MWESPHAQELVTTTFKLQVTCNKCFRILSDEESMSIVPLRVTSNVQTSLNIFLQTEELTESDSFFFFLILVRATNQHLLIMKSQKQTLI